MEYNERSLHSAAVSKSGLEKRYFLALVTKTFCQYGEKR